MSIGARAAATSALIVIMAAAGLQGATAGDKGQGVDSSAPALSTTLDPYTAKETMGPFTIIVGCRMTAMAWDEHHLPIQIGIGIYGRKSPRLTITRSSFVLLDAEGGVHPLLPVSAIDPDAVSAHKKVAYRMPLNIGNNFEFLATAQANFYPVGGSDGSQWIELNPHTWLRDLFYFERPDSGMDGVLTLQFVAKGLGQPMRVRFQIPTTGPENR